MLTALLPPDTEESQIKQMMAEVEETCARLDMQVLGGHTEITDAVNRPVLTVTGIGKGKKNGCLLRKI